MMILSVDGGATKTVSLVIDEEKKKLLSVGLAEASNFNAVGEDNAKQNLFNSISLALSYADLEPNDIDFAIFSLAGVGDSKESDMIANTIVRSVSPSKRYLIFNDGVVAYRATNLYEDGIMVASGTGNVNFYQKNGNLYRVGGWGWFVGDEGSASWVAKRALTYATRQYDNLIEGKELVKAAEQFFGDEFKELIWKLEMRHEKPYVASFATIVSKLAKEGSKIADKVLDEASDYVALVINSVLKEFEGKNVRVSVTGGLMLAGDILINKIKAKVNAPLHVFYGYQHAVGGLAVIRKDVTFDDMKAILKELDQLLVKTYTPEKLKKLLYFERPPGGWG